MKIQTVSQPVVLLPSGHFVSLPLRAGGYEVEVTATDPEGYMVRFASADVSFTALTANDVLLYAVDVREADALCRCDSVDGAHEVTRACY